MNLSEKSGKQLDAWGETFVARKRRVGEGDTSYRKAVEAAREKLYGTIEAVAQALVVDA